MSKKKKKILKNPLLETGTRFRFLPVESVAALDRGTIFVHVAVPARAIAAAATSVPQNRESPSNHRRRKKRTQLSIFSTDDVLWLRSFPSVLATIPLKYRRDLKIEHCSNCAEKKKKPRE